MFEIVGKSFDTEKEMLDFIVENESFVIDTKKAQKTKSEPFNCGLPIAMKSFDVVQKGDDSEADATVIQRKTIINTSNILDSHKDVHIPKLWDQSIKQRGDKVMHLQEHGRSFKDVIARGDDLKVSAPMVTWKSLGLNMEGKTNALTFDSTIRQSQNKEMCD